MAMLLKRIAVLICIPAGLVLLIGPLNTFQHKYVEQEFVFISAHVKDTRDVFTLKDNQLESYPELRKILEERSWWFKNINPREAALLKDESRIQGNPYTLLAIRTQQNIWRREATRLPPDEWRRMTRELFGTQDDTIRFAFHGLFFESAIKLSGQFTDIEVPGLDAARKVTGGVLMAAALFLYTPLRRKQKGIPVGRPGVIFLWDMLVILVALIFSHAAIDLVFMKLFETQPYWDFYLHFMGVFFTLAAIPCVSLFISLTAAQSIQVNDDGIISRGLFMKTIMAWTSIRSIELKDYYSPKQVGGMIAPKHLTQVMTLEGADGSLSIMEPPLTSSKQAIITALSAHAPQHLRNRLQEISREW